MVDDKRGTESSKRNPCIIPAQNNTFCWQSNCPGKPMLPSLTPRAGKNFFFSPAKLSFRGNCMVFICGFTLGNGCQHFASVKLALGSVYSFKHTLSLCTLLDTTINFNMTDRRGMPHQEVSILSMHAGTFWWCDRPAPIFIKMCSMLGLLVKAGSSLSEYWAYYRLMRPVNGQPL